MSDEFNVRERTFTGVHRGRYLLDPVTMVPWIRSDTTRLSGDQIVTRPDGRSFSTALTWERNRDTRLWRPGEVGVRQDFLQTERRRVRALGGGSASVARLRSRISDGDDGPRTVNWMKNPSKA